MRCVFANATFAGGHTTARSHENRSRGVVLSCRARWHMRGGMRVPYHACAPQQREQRSRFGHHASKVLTPYRVNVETPTHLTPHIDVREPNERVFAMHHSKEDFKGFRMMNRKYSFVRFSVVGGGWGMGGCFYINPGRS